MPSNGYGRIMAPVDFSKPSLAALRSATAIAKKHDARLQAVHVVDPAALGAYSSDHFAPVNERGNEERAQFIETADLVRPVEPIVAQGSVHEHITQLAEENGAEFAAKAVATSI